MKKTIQELNDIASQVRRDIVRMVTAAKSGHPGGSLSSTDILTALYFNEMEQDAATWTREAKGQDAFILSAGHLAPVYYAVLARAGYFDPKEMGSLRKFGSDLQGHPSVGHIKGIFQPSGSLGQGLSAAAGIALGKKLDGDPHRAFVLCGDGESEEGQIWEAAMFAVHHKLDNLVAMTDWNGMQIDGPIETVTGIEELNEKWLAFGWDVIVAEGHDYESILNAFQIARKQDGKPKMILFKTEMGHGVDFMAGSHKWHGKAPSAEQCAQALEQLKETLGDY
ncbi:MAG: transketolase [Bacteroidales bacterium]|jgi:transketolase|nr:transketolase [Bacteroidales bacterium]